MTKYRILSLDGGGIFGLISIILMQKLQQHYERERNILKDVSKLQPFPPAFEPETWFERADLIVGTSTGALIMFGLAKGLTLDEIRRFYEEGDKVLIKKEKYNHYQSVLPVTDDAVYDNTAMAKTYKNILGNTTLGQLTRKVMFPAFDLDPCSGDEPEYWDDPAQTRRCWRSKVFHNLLPSKDDTRPLWKLAMYATGAPAYHPIFEGFIDGGIYATNPSMIAYAYTQDTTVFSKPSDPKDVCILNIGPGDIINYVDLSKDDGDWGLKRWMLDNRGMLIDVLMAGGTDQIPVQCRQILGDRFRRIAPDRINDPSLAWVKADEESIRKITDIGEEAARQVDQVGDHAGMSSWDWLLKVWLAD